MAPESISQSLGAVATSPPVSAGMRQVPINNRFSLPNLWVIGILALNAVLWIIPSNVVELVARDHHTLLGRYSRTHFGWMLGLVPISWMAIHLILARDAAERRVKTFRIIAVLMVLFPSVIVLDAVLRWRQGEHYSRDGLSYHRPLNAAFKATYSDRPKAMRTYPHPKPGYPDIPVRLTTDKRGFRNKADLPQYDVVVLGDSFAEGSGVSDEQAWPVKFAELSGRSVYNLGMSGYAPQHYLATLKEHGLALKPKRVICVLYEGNDFDAAEITNKPKSRLNRLFKSSPLRDMLDEFLIRTLAPIECHRELPSLDILSWLPVTVPEEDSGKAYTFFPRHLLDLGVDRTAFQASKDWQATVHNLKEMQGLCKQAGAEFILVYAPSKVHVIFPLMADALPADKVRAFAALRADDSLPPADQFIPFLADRVDNFESVTAEWCAKQGIRFVSVTDVLRKAAAEGRQVYFTYDQHWTPDGHEVVAKFLAGTCGRSL